MTIQQFIKKSVHSILGIPGFGYHSIRYKPESRDIKYEELGEMYYGEIDVDIVKEIASTSPIKVASSPPSRISSPCGKITLCCPFSSFRQIIPTIIPAGNSS